MPESNILLFVFLAMSVVVGVIVGWTLRGRRSMKEKAAVNAGWQEQVKAQRSEHDRLTEQNKGLMEQINQYQASNKDAKNRAKELSIVVQEAFAKRDELQREIKDIRGNLEVAMTERDQLQSDMAANSDVSAQLNAKDDRIAKLQVELANWQERVPPLIERFRVRNAEAEELVEELADAREQIEALEAANSFTHTRIEPVSDPDALTNGRDASNDALEGSDERTGYAEALAREIIAAEPAANVEDGLRDRLQMIKGVGPAIEKTLNEMGIFRFQQIADMSEYDIDRVAQRLKGFHSRIYREDWIGQARQLNEQRSDR